MSKTLYIVVPCYNEQEVLPETAKRLLEKLRSLFLKNKIADNRRSLGLGLYLCKAIVEAHGGTIRVEDNQPQGAVFRFTLPLEEVVYHE